MITKNLLHTMFEKIDTFLLEDQTICIIGSAIVIEMEMPSRTTMDIDIWKYVGKINLDAFKKAVIESGYLFAPDD